MPKKDKKNEKSRRGGGDLIRTQLIYTCMIVAKLPMSSFSNCTYTRIVPEVSDQSTDGSCCLKKKNEYCRKHQPYKA